jgi:hypothetical protein
MEPIGWMLLGGFIALALAPNIKRVVQQSEMTNESMRKVPKLKNIIRVRKRNMAVGSNKTT